MKNILTAIALGFTISVSAQVAIGKNSVTNSSVSLEFGNVQSDLTKQKGILLPWVVSESAVQTAGVVPGTLIFDSTDKKVKYYKGGTTPYWFDLTVDTNGVVNTAAQNSLTELTNAKATIGTPTNTPGLFVLEDTNKAMVLPIVDRYSTVENPSSGMMVYDKANNMICFYNGSNWTFWQPDN